MGNVFVYTEAGCEECKKVKDDLQSQGVLFQERPAASLTSAGDKDEVDLEAMVEMQMQRGELPIVVRL